MKPVCAPWQRLTFQVEGRGVRGYFSGDAQARSNAILNSTMGWSGAANAFNFADPANRDAVLNRKLSDNEIRAFQAGSVPTDMQALIDQYRSRTTAAAG